MGILKAYMIIVSSFASKLSMRRSINLSPFYLSKRRQWSNVRKISYLNNGNKIIKKHHPKDFTTVMSFTSDSNGDSIRKISSPSSFSKISAVSSSLLPPFFEVTKTLLAGTGVTLVALSLLYLNQEKLLYFPQIDGYRFNSENPPGYRSPEEYGIPFEEHWIPVPATTKEKKKNGTIEIHSWLLLQSDDDNNNNKSTRPTIVLFHGNAGNIGYRLPIAKKMYDSLNCNIFMVEYRCYGDSRDKNYITIKPTEAGLKLDAEAAIQFIRQHPKIDPSKIILFGTSLGGAVAFHVAQKWQQQQRNDDTSSMEEEQEQTTRSRPPVTPPLAGRTRGKIEELSKFLMKKGQIDPQNRIHRISTKNRPHVRTRNSSFHLLMRGCRLLLLLSSLN